ncbi:hypothetical protein ACFVHS_41645 [Streptomyces sp. NPDC057746]|uniref:hypothetical protein n=1 Tax=unclassified Streptomyces TaxID=2593676 RepID=UPI00368CCF04
MLLPRSLHGRKRRDDRTVLNRIVGKFRTGTARRDVPATRHDTIAGSCRAAFTFASVLMRA